MKEIPCKGGDEYDAFTGWRRVLSWKAGTLKYIKTKYRKRCRQAAKQAIKQEIEDNAKDNT